MRSVMIAASGFAIALSACGGNGEEPAGPERQGAAGEVLGGEITDDMLPLDTVRSTSPVAPRTGTAGPSTPGATATVGVQSPESRRASVPRPEVSGGPEPLPNDPTAPDAPTPPQP